MRKRVQVTLVVLAVALVGVVAYSALRQPEPVYQGKCLSSWLADLDLGSASSPEKATQAVRAIGPRAFPVLLRMLRAEDPLWRRGIIAFNARQSFIQVRVSPSNVIRHRAVQGYGALGAAARGQVGPLAQILDSAGSLDVRLDAAAALGAIGPEARAAIPALCKAAQGQNRELRNRALFALADIQRWELGEPIKLGF